MIDRVAGVFIPVRDPRMGRGVPREMPKPAPWFFAAGGSMRFRRQSIVGLGALVVLIATTAMTGIIALHITGARADELATNYVEDLSRVHRLRYLAERVVATSRGYLLTGERSLRAQFVEARDELLDSLGETAVRSRDPGAVVPVALAYMIAASDVVGERSSVHRPAEIVPMFERVLEPRRAELETTISAFTQQRRELFQRELRDADEGSERAEIAVVASSLLAIACGLAWSVLVSRRLARQFRAVEDATAKAERSAQAREEMLAVVSHDLRNPLQAISLSATLLGETTGGRPVQTIHHAAERMRHMIDELLEVSRIDNDQIELHREPLTSGELLDEAVEMFRETAKAHDIELTFDAPQIQVLADRERVVEILSNLLGNALKFSPRDTRIAARAEPSGDVMRFSVADAGPGISAEQLPHLFDRFWQGDRKKRRDGLGLGLYICKRLVEAHHGAIGCDSRPGAGSTFWFTLPRA
jgi:signal transduction histidine kinase